MIFSPSRKWCWTLVLRAFVVRVFSAIGMCCCCLRACVVAFGLVAVGHVLLPSGVCWWGMGLCAFVDSSVLWWLWLRGARGVVLGEFGLLVSRSLVGFVSCCILWEAFGCHGFCVAGHVFSVFVLTVGPCHFCTKKDLYCVAVWLLVKPSEYLSKNVRRTKQRWLEKIK